MLYGLQGIIETLTVTSVVLNVTNVFYELLLPSTEGLVKGDNVFLFTHEVMREDERFLIGFQTKGERALFQDLIKVTGIGPKTALGILTATTVDKFTSAIYTEDLYYLKKLPGVGPKGASQLILDLKGKLRTNIVKQNSGKEEELLSALMNLGFKKSDATKMIKKVFDEKHSLNELLKLALSEFRGL